MIKQFLLIAVWALFLSACTTVKKENKERVVITKTTLQDKIAGGWAGKMLGVAYGVPTEFKALGEIYEKPINWQPSAVIRSQWEDDIYVQLTFMETMDKYGRDAPAKKYQELLAKASL